MDEILFSEYSIKHVHFFDEEVPVLLEFGCSLINRALGKLRIVDLGCGDGRLIFALYAKGLLQSVDDVVGVDISEDRINRLKMVLPFVRGIVSSALNVGELPASFFDFVICSQLIEHVDDNGALMLEIKRLLKNEGLVYLSSVVKKRHGMYFYFKDGTFRLDPYHLREYASVDEFVGLISSTGFEVISARTCQIMYPLLDLFIRLLVKIGLIEVNVGFYQKHAFLNKIRELRMPVFGFSGVEVLAKRIG